MSGVALSLLRADRDKVCVQNPAIERWWWFSLACIPSLPDFRWFTRVSERAVRPTNNLVCQLQHIVQCKHRTTHMPCTHGERTKMRDCSESAWTMGLINLLLLSYYFLNLCTVIRRCGAHQAPSCSTPSCKEIKSK